MSIDLRARVIRRAVADLITLVGEIAARLARAQRLSTDYPDALSVIERLRPVVQAHFDQLVSYLDETGGAEASGELAIREPAPAGEAAVLDHLRELCLAFHHCTLKYGMLYEVALRLYEPRLREVAPEHLKIHAGAALSVAQLLPGVLARELAEEGFHCACICPMCSVGACGCVYYGTLTLVTAWRDVALADAGQPGFVLQSPRPDSQLARAGVQEGDVVLAVDGQRVGDFPAAQSAIRKHALGDEVRLLIQRRSDSPRELNVTHVSDYPKT